MLICSFEDFTPPKFENRFIGVTLLIEQTEFENRFIGVTLLIEQTKFENRYIRVTLLIERYNFIRVLFSKQNDG